jgi:hypothetical protein
MKRFILVALWLLSQTGLHASPLWGGTESGMSVVQILKKFDGAIVPTDPSELASGATEKVRVPSTKHLGHEFMVRFYFKGEGLEQVTLALKNPGKRKELTKIADSIAKDLSMTLGEPKRRTVEDTAAKTLDWCWDRSDQRVSIFMISFGPTDELSNGGFLNLNYQRPKSGGGQVPPAVHPSSP